MASNGSGPLAGRRIIDFTWAWAGPYGAMLLSLLGAEVIKVESATRIDHSRVRSLSMGAFSGGLNQAPMFNELNLNKQSITLNLKTAGAKEVVRRLAAVSDGAIDNFRPGTLDKLGLGYEDLRAINDDFVMVSASALGAHGPERFYVGYAPTFAALAGLSALTGLPEEPPLSMGGAIDLRAGTAAAFAMLMALQYRDRSGRGQFVDASSREAVAIHLGEEFLRVALTGRDGERQGNQHNAFAPHGAYRCAPKGASDSAPHGAAVSREGEPEASWVAIACRSDHEWEALCDATGLSGLREDDRFSTGLRRWKHRDALDHQIETWTRERSAANAARTLLEAGVPASPSLWGKGLYEDPHFQARLSAVPVKPAEMDQRLMLAPPWRFSLTPAAIRTPAPTLGEHTADLLSGLLNYGDAEIESLEAEGALQ